MIDIQAVQGRTIALGRLGENNYTRILFDVSGWLADYPSASIGLLNVRPGQTTAYPVSPENLSLSDGVLYWTVTNADLSAKGTGRCELVAYQGNTIMKSAIFKTMCLEALDGGATPPEPWESWQSFFQALADNAAQSASDAEAAVEHYPRIVDGIWKVWDAQAGAYVSTGISATGPQGERGETGSQGPRGETGATGAAGADGFSPVATVTQTASGATISITDKQGTTTANISNGQDGSPGQPGQDGTDGVSPTVTVTDITGGHRITITDATGAHSFDVMDGQDGGGAVQDVQVNGTSVVQDGVANVPVATPGILGVVKPTVTYGVNVLSGGGLGLVQPTDAQVKSGIGYVALFPSHQHKASFYGLAKAAGADMKDIASTTVGTYPEAQKSAISTMLNGSVSVSGTTPSITALPGIQYVCGEVATLDIALPASGCIDVVFQSGSTATVLTVTPPTGVTVKWAGGFDPTSLDANTTYELNIKDGLGVTGSWT